MFRKILKSLPLLLLLCSPSFGLGITSPVIRDHADLDGLTTGDDHTQYQKESEKDQVNGYAGLDGSGDISASALPNHAANHTDGTDDIQDATAAQKGVATAVQITKLDGIETGATADQTNAEIKTAYEANANTNEFDDAEQTKLSNAAELPITRADHDTGVDGEIPTWDASGNPSKVPVGTVGQVLTSGGVGVAPTFQTPTTATKEFFKYPMSSSTAETNLGNFRSVNLNAVSEAFFTFFVPNDYVSTTSIIVLVIPDTTETIQYDLFASVAAAGAAHDSDDRSSLNETLGVTVDLLTEIDITPVLGTLAAGDFIGFKIESDTSSIRIAGLRFRYQ